MPRVVRSFKSPVKPKSPRPKAIDSSDDEESQRHGDASSNGSQSEGEEDCIAVSGRGEGSIRPVVRSSRGRHETTRTTEALDVIEDNIPLIVGILRKLGKINRFVLYSVVLMILMSLLSCSMVGIVLRITDDEPERGGPLKIPEIGVHHETHVVKQVSQKPEKSQKPQKVKDAPKPHKPDLQKDQQHLLDSLGVEYGVPGVQKRKNSLPGWAKHPEIARGERALFLGSDIVYSSCVANFCVRNGVQLGECRVDSDFLHGRAGQITVKEHTFAKGIVMHAPGAAAFTLKKKYDTFKTCLGFSQDKLHPGCGIEQGEARFRVLGDSKVLYHWSFLRASADQNCISVSVKGVKTLRLETGINGKCDACGYATWISPQLTAKQQKLWR
eukprot:gnl/MRDRNA2_/MRDRNA2_215837_c0_seq1.p1 gnl/MRDRNA2_/MRDRNA2_215837_c0~~gnl/MRDRNA2_/MRDRNA2_215837_c0_seq1.p1  ORF type:complete len:384 (+),score=62.85 gnl/MRDRNA2_/MRDRNA2_215837_c0_seq1:220-1371(+)